MDDSWEGFQWIAHDDHANSVVAFRRIDEKGDEIVAVCNFTPNAIEDYRIGVPACEGGAYVEMLNSDAREFGGSGVVNKGELKLLKEARHGFEQTLQFRLPPLGCAFFKSVGSVLKTKKKLELAERARLAAAAAKHASEAAPEEKPVKKPRTAKKTDGVKAAPKKSAAKTKTVKAEEKPAEKKPRTRKSAAKEATAE